jgi:hypothetical protein
MGHPTATRWGVARELGYLLMTDEGDFWSQSPESSSPHMGPLQALSSGDVFLVNACGSGLHDIAGLQFLFRPVQGPVFLLCPPLHWPTQWMATLNT